jgi:hypothetical protein
MCINNNRPVASVLGRKGLWRSPALAAAIAAIAAIAAFVVSVFVVVGVIPATTAATSTSARPTSFGPTTMRTSARDDEICSPRTLGGQLPALLFRHVFEQALFALQRRVRVPRSLQSGMHLLLRLQLLLSTTQSE